MNKIYEKVLADYKKANKLRKQKTIEAYGFKTEKEFLNFLKGNNVIIASAPLEPDVQPTDYVIAFDTTGSMSAYISAVKKHVKSLIPTLFADTPNLKLQIIAFGDYCDMTSQNVYGKAYQVSNFTNNENELIEFINNAEKTSGGDGDEFYELVIKRITSETPWRTNSKRNVLFIGDAAPHHVGYIYNNMFTKVNIASNIDWRKEAKLAAQAGIQFDTLSILGHNFYKELATITNGVCVLFNNAEKVSNIVEASAAVRYNKDKFRTMSLTAEKSGDVELIGAYKSMSTLL